MTTRASLPLLASLVFFLPAVVLSQELFSPLETFTIETEPPFPSPGETITLRARGNDLELSRGTILWTANGKTLASGVGLKDTTLKLGELGSSITIEASVTAPDGSVSSATRVIRPTEVDLLWSARSYSPLFFRGKPLPSAGVAISFEAISRIRTAGGRTIPPDELIYTWKRDNKTLPDISGRGKYLALVPAPPPFGTYTISVIVSSLDGSYVGNALRRISTHDPRILLYRDHSLFGVLDNAAVGSGYVVNDREATFIAVPYYADVPQKSDEYIFDWTVNNESISRGSENRITIRTENANVARIELVFDHVRNWLQNTRASWNIMFETAPNGALFGQE